MSFAPWRPWLAGQKCKRLENEAGKRRRRGAPDVGGEEGTVFCKLVEGDRGAMGLRHKE